LNCPNSPSIRCTVDTCAALSTGSFHFHASVAERFPYCVAKVFSLKEYLPIVLSGIVQSSEQAIVTTKLEVGWQLQLPYRTKEGDNTSFSIATGPRVSINSILGLSFMQATGLITDLVDNIAKCKHLRSHGGGLISLNWVATGYKPYHYDMGDAKNPLRLDNNFITYLYKVFKHLPMQWMAIWVLLTSSNPWRCVKLAEPG
jgi:hypothetical protein